MALNIAPGGTTTLTATAYQDAANTVVATSAVISWATDNPAVVNVVDDGSAAGVGHAALSVHSAGSANVIARATNQDGTFVDSAPFAVTVAPAPSGNAVSVVITQP